MTRDLVVCSLEAWDEVRRRNQYLVAGLLERDPRLRVLFVEPPADPVHDALALRRRPAAPRGLVQRDDFGLDRLWTLQQTKPGPRRPFGPAVDAALTRGVRRAARRLDLRRPLLWINDPSRAPLLAATGWPSLYDITDDWAAARRPHRELARTMRNEAVLLRDCDQVVVCSDALRAAKGTQRGVELVTNGVDVQRYREPAPRPGDLPGGPAAVYVGTLHEDRLDVDLCLDLAAGLRGSATLVLVGPDALSPANSLRLRSADGVAVLGARPYDTIPAYLQHAAVLVVPHRVDGFTESLDPIKLYEYLAVDPPVVATPVAGFRDRPDQVTVADRAGFVAAVRRTLTQGTSVRVRPAGIPDWGTQVDAMSGVLDRLGV